jgi:aspartate-semialdehyde dehydrogenase
MIKLMAEWQLGGLFVAEGIRLAIVGATGAVGQEMLKVLEERKFNIKEILCLADPREAGTKIKFKGEAITVRKALPEAFAQSDIALFAVNTEISQQLAPMAAANNCVVIDNSYAFRMEDGVPLVVPEVNPGDIAAHRGIIANPNCSTIIMVVAINPIHLAAGLKRVVVSTYQAVSGAGKAGIDELENSTRAYLDQRPIKPVVFQHPIAFNLIPHIDVFGDDNYTREEMKMVWETRKIMHAPDLKIAPTAVRVPVFRSHSESINLETEKFLSVERVREILSAAPGVVVQDDPANNLYPMPLYASDKDEVFVGRIRRDMSVENGLAIWVAADQIRKGAATNAIQIAEIVAAKNLY